MNMLLSLNLYLCYIIYQVLLVFFYKNYFLSVRNIYPVVYTPYFLWRLTKSSASRLYIEVYLYTDA